MPRFWENLGPVESIPRAMLWVLDAEGKEPSHPIELRNARPHRLSGMHDAGLRLRHAMRRMRQVSS